MISYRQLQSLSSCPPPTQTSFCHQSDSFAIGGRTVTSKDRVKYKNGSTLVVTKLELLWVSDTIPPSKGGLKWRLHIFQA